MSKKSAFFLGLLMGFLFFYSSAFIFGGIIGFDFISSVVTNSSLAILTVGIAYSVICGGVVYLLSIFLKSPIHKYSLISFIFGFFIPYLMILVGVAFAIKNSTWF